MADVYDAIADAKAKGKGDKPIVAVAGGGGFIGSHIAKKLYEDGHYVICSDWKKNEYFEENQFCDKFFLCDLREKKHCLQATKGAEWCFNLAADMGGMGFIQSNHSVIVYNNTLITLHMLEASRYNGVKRIFYASSACAYPEHRQDDEKTMTGLKEDDAWPARPQDLYGLEKLYGEEAYIGYAKDFDIKCRIARFHNIYGGHATWKDGREKAPAAFCRKVAASKSGDTLDMWGDGKQTRSFCHIDDCVEGVLKLFHSDIEDVLNIGSDEMVSMNEMMEMIATFENKDIKINHIPGPEGVRGRNSENTKIKQLLGWAPPRNLKEGLQKTYDWIKGQIEKERAAGINNDYSGSKIVQQSTETLDNLTN